MRRHTLLLLFISLCFAVPAQGQFLWDESEGINGGTVLKIIDTETGIFAATDGGVYKSTDSGLSWTRAGSIAGTTALVETGGVFVAAAQIGLIYRSTDGGTSWSRNGGLEGSYVSSMAVTPSGFILAGTGGVMRIGAGMSEDGGIYRSTDGGVSWEEVTGRTRYNIVWDVFVDAAGIIYAGTFDGTLRSSDEGETWENIGGAAYSVYSDGAGLLLKGGEGRIYRSTDGGATSSIVADDIVGFVTSITADEDATFYAGSFTPFGGGMLYVSRDGGENWSPAASSRPILTLGATSGGVFVGTEFRGVLRSADDGATWQPASAGLTALPVSAIGGRSVLFAGTRHYYDCASYCGSDGAVYRSEDGGRSWAPAGLEGSAIHDFVFGPSGRVYALTPDGVFQIDGEGWKALPTPSTGGAVWALHEADDGTLYAGMGGMRLTYDSGVYRSSDGGETWEALGGDPGPIAAFALFGGSLYAASGGNIYELEDDPRWIRRSLATAFRFAQTDTELFALGNALFRTADGRSWETLDLPGRGPRDIAVNSAGQVIVSTYDGIFMSNSGGATWTRVGDAATHMTVTGDDRIVAAGRQNGLFHSVEPVVLSDETLPQLEVALDAPYPNPTAGEARITFRLDAPSHVRLDVYDLLGRRIEVLLDGMMPAGSHEAGWEAAGVPSGTYLVRLQLGDAQMSRPLVLVR